MSDNIDSRANPKPLRLLLKSGNYALISHSPLDDGDQEIFNWVVNGEIEDNPSIHVVMQSERSDDDSHEKFILLYYSVRSDLESVDEVNLAYTLNGAGHELICAVLGYIDKHHPQALKNSKIELSDEMLNEAEAPELKFFEELGFDLEDVATNSQKIFKKCATRERQVHIEDRVGALIFRGGPKDRKSLKATWNQFCEQAATELYAEYYLPELRGMAKALGLKYSGLNKAELCKLIGTFIIIMERTGTHPTNLKGYISEEI